MKSRKRIIKEGLFKGVIIDPSLNGKYDNDPLILAKAERARQILEKCPPPKFITDPEHKTKAD